MTYYEDMLQQLKTELYANQGQIDTVIGLRSYIESHYASDLNLDQLSQVQLVSKYHLLRLFKRYYGLTPRQYLTDIRIDKARAHLQQGLSVTETCFAVGFNSLGSFSALFKRKTGKSPVQYQKEQLSRSKSIPDS